MEDKMNFQTFSLLFRCSKEFGHKRIHASGLSDTECMICGYLYTNEGCSQNDVVINMKMDKATVAKALNSLENKGLVTRSVDQEDRRKNILHITEAGKEKTASIIMIHDQWLNSIMEVLSEVEQKQFEGYCLRLISAAEKLLKD